MTAHDSGTTAGGVVSAGDPRTAYAGARLLREGGNAVDAAVGAVMAAFAAEPVLTGPFGGGFGVVGGVGTSPEVHAFFAEVPGRGLPPAATDPSLDFVAVEVDFGATTQVFHVGRGAAAVGLLAPGLLGLHRRHGRLDLHAVAAPALELAREGVPLSEQLARIFEILHPILVHSPEARALFEPAGHLLGRDEPYRSADLPPLLEALARGDAAAGRAGLLAAFGPPAGRITAVDLDEAHPLVAAPVEVAIGDALEVHLPPPPSAGGLLVAFGLRLLEHVPVAVWRDTLEAAHHFLAAMAVTTEARRAALDAALHGEADLETVARSFLADAHLDRWRDRFDRAVQDGPAGGFDAAPDLGSTTHVSVVDAAGLACAVTHSNGEGCGHVVPGAGVLSNNFLGEEDLHPAGFHHAPAGARLTSMMCPTLVTRDGEPVLALGSGGSNRIRTAVLQVLVHHLLAGRSLRDAVDMPRLHLEGDHLYVERRGPGGTLPEAVLASLAGRVPQMTVFDGPSMFFGGVHAAGPGGRGAGDPRRGGAIARA